MRFLKPIAAVVLTLTPGLAYASGGTESPFALGAGAADLSLGGAQLAVNNSWTAPYWNPSGLASAEVSELGGFHSRLYDSDVAYQYFGVVYPTLDLGTLGIGVFRLGIDGIEKRDASNLYLGNIDDSRLGIYLAYGKTMASYSVGLSLSMEHHSIDQFSSTSSPGLTLSIGRKWRFDSKLEAVSASVVVRNALSPSMKLDNADVTYPISTDIAISADLIPKQGWNHHFSLYSKLTKVDALAAMISAGAQYSIADLLYLRGGINDGHPAGGVGISVGKFAFDFAIVDRDLGSLQMFSLTSRFGKPRSQKLREREEQSERDFNRLMSDQIEASNERMLAQLLERGNQALDEGDLEQAEISFDRALFLSRADSRDTTEIVEKLADIRTRLNEVTRLRQYNDLLDSAQIAYGAEDFLGARYYASLALQLVESSVQAKEILAQSQKKLQEESSREGLIEQRILLADSLVNFGRGEEAISLLLSLKELAPSDIRVDAAIKRARFEQFRSTASQAYGQNQYSRALRALDSALTYYPGHQWCLQMKTQIEQRLANVRQADNSTAAPKPTILSEELKREVDQYYRRGQDSFRAGDLKAAIASWEQVERIAPNYERVREYLVNAYKFVGVEQYGDGLLKEAVMTWRKAARLMPGNQEIAEYINRTESEIKKLDELSYEP